MKVSKAKTLICPFIQEASVLNTENNYPEGVNANINCICGDCMAFVYTKQHSSTKNEEFTEKAGDVTYLKTRAKELPENEKEGYCKRLK